MQMVSIWGSENNVSKRWERRRQVPKPLALHEAQRKIALDPNLPGRNEKQKMV